MKPTDQAREYKRLKEFHGTLEKVAEAANVSTSTISRYLALLKLPTEIQDQVDAGKLSVKNPTLKKRARRQSTLGDLELLFLDRLTHCRYATHKQLTAYSGKSASHAKGIINTLISMGLIDVNKEFNPFTYSLSRKGYAFKNKGKPKHFVSANAIHQHLVRNQIEIQMKEKDSQARFVARKSCWDMGLFPSVGEHLISYNANGKLAYALVIIDDYLMQPQRLTHRLNRFHDRDKTKVKGTHTLRWLDVTSLVFIYVTDKVHLSNHEAFVRSSKDTLGAKVVIRYIEPIWRLI